MASNVSHDYFVFRKPKSIEELSDIYPDGVRPISVDTGGEDSEAVEVVIEVESVDQQQRQELLGDPNVARLLRTIPTVRATPVSTGREVVETAGQQCWGLSAVRALESGAKGAGVRVAILDTGIDLNHPCFADMHAEGKICYKQYASDGAEPDTSHGTHCAGTFFGQDVNGMRVGVAPGIEKAYVAKVIGQSSSHTGHLKDAVYWAGEKNVHIITTSVIVDLYKLQEELLNEHSMHPRQAFDLAMNTHADTVEFFDSIIQSLSVRTGTRNGCLFIGAAGNDSDRPNMKVKALFPGASQHALSVGALKKPSDASSNILGVSHFSNDGVSLIAPGERILSAMSGSAGLVEMDGTSMAAPHAAGVAALWAEVAMQNGKFNPNEVANYLMHQCVPLPEVDFEAQGSGLVQAPVPA